MEWYFEVGRVMLYFEEGGGCSGILKRLGLHYKECWRCIILNMVVWYFEEGGGVFLEGAVVL